MVQKKSAARPSSRPPLLLLVAAGALVLIIAGVMLTSGRPALQPGAGTGARLAVEPENIDFGRVQVEQPVTARFVVRNDGSENLQILGQPQVRLVDGC